MKLNESERDFIRETCEFYSDKRISIELTRMRYSVGVKEAVTLYQVQHVRRDMGKKKGPDERIR